MTEEALDLEAMNALATEKKQDAEISYLRQRFVRSVIQR